MALAQELSAQTSIKAACTALSVGRASFYRGKKGEAAPRSKAVRAKRPSPRALEPAERQTALSLLHSERFVDMAPAAIHAQLLDEGRYVCSSRTFYRLLSAEGEVKERRNQLRHPHYQAPELLATAPNQVWSWDITKLKGWQKWTFFYLYVLLDIFSRYVVGWLVANRESGALARELIRETCLKQRVSEHQLTLHSDRGPSMTSKTVALLLADLGVTKSLGRPSVSNDNPFSESHFKTLKYRPEFPDRFGSLLQARAFCQRFFRWYNMEHRHSGIGMLTPETVHYGRAAHVIAARQQVLNEAFRDHPERFVRKPPRPLQLPAAVWINPPVKPVENDRVLLGEADRAQTSRVFALQSIFATESDALDGPDKHQIERNRLRSLH